MSENTKNLSNTPWPVDRIANNFERAMMLFNVQKIDDVTYRFLINYFGFSAMNNIEGFWNYYKNHLPALCEQIISAMPPNYSQAYFIEKFGAKYCESVVRGVKRIKELTAVHYELVRKDKFLRDKASAIKIIEGLKKQYDI